MFINEGNNVRITALWKINTNRGTHASEPRSFYSLSFRLSGFSTYKCDGENYVVNEGDIVFFPKGKAFINKHNENESFVVNFECSEDLKPNIFEVFAVKSPETYRALFTELFEVWDKRESGSTFMAASIFYRILHMLCNEISNQEMENHISKPQLIREYLMKHYSEQTLTISQLASTFSTSDSYLRRVFQREFGMSPKKYILSLRLSQAENLLKSGHFSITEVAQRCGFANQKYFSNFFRTEFGMTPSKYVHDFKAGCLVKEIRLE